VPLARLRTAVVAPTVQEGPSTSTPMDVDLDGQQANKRCSLDLHQKQCPDGCPISCELCDWRFTTPAKLTVHKKEKHEAEFLLERPLTGPKKWANNKKCTHCGRMIGLPFWQRYVNECPFYTDICRLCPHRFRYVYLLEQHMTRVHSNIVAPDVPDGPD
jgi:hypothetical protein